jgi:hypothetical protein
MVRGHLAFLPELGGKRRRLALDRATLATRHE